MADKREQCEKCTMNCPSNIIQSKINKGRIPFDKCLDFTPIHTNADKIRSMTDEELAEFLDNNVPDCGRLCPDFKAGCSWTCSHNQGKDFLLKWLQSEAEKE